VREIDRIDVDLVVSRRPIHTADVECAALMEDYAIAVCGRQTAQRIANVPYPKVLEQAPVLLLESEPAWGGRLGATELKGKSVQRGATIDDPRVLLEAVVQEQGIGYVSRVLASQALADGRVHMLTQVPTVSRPRLWLMRTRLSPRTQFANLAFNWLRETALHD
jgi:LysR family glycine cleavage system transcriptional activator